MIRGIDISDNNGSLNIPLLAENNIAFVSLKAAQGLTELDPDFQTWYHGLRDTQPKIIRIPYFFFDWYSDGVAQAEHLLSRGVNYTEAGTGPAMLDLECDSGSAVEAYIIANRSVCIQRVNDFKSTLLGSPLYGRPDMIIYSFDDFIDNTIRQTWPDTVYWVASYQPTPPPKMPEWPYQFWQYSEFGKLDGTVTGGNYDLDQFMGTQEELNALANIEA